MAAITTYSTLKTELIATTEDDGTEFDAYVPTMVDLVEERLMRECDFPELNLSDYGSLTSSQNTLTMPNDLDSINFFNITVGSNKQFLKYRTEDYLYDYWPNSATTDVPKYYTIEGTTGNIVMAPTPDSGYSYQLNYVKPPTKLSASNETNYFVDECPDLLFYACMVEAVKFLKAWSQVPVWEETYQNARLSWNYQAARQRRDSLDVPKNPEGGRNNITNNIQGNTTA
jgi:hypothetical protein